MARGSLVVEGALPGNVSIEFRMERGTTYLAK